MDDLEFVHRCASGDKQSWEEFVDRYSRLIYSYILSILNIKSRILPQDNINDIFQEIIYSLIKDNFKKLKSFKARNACSLASWLRQVTINCTIDYLRKLKPTVSIDEENSLDLSLKEILTQGSSLNIDLIEYKEKLSHLKDCIKWLNKEDKYFLELYINRELSLDDLRDHLRITRGAVDMRKSRIIERLKDCFKIKGFALDF